MVESNSSLEDGAGKPQPRKAFTTEITEILHKAFFSVVFVPSVVHLDPFVARRSRR